MFFSFKIVGSLQVIHQPLSRPKQVRAGEYAVSKKIGLETVNIPLLQMNYYFKTNPTNRNHINKFQYSNIFHMKSISSPLCRNAEL
jgi:hypothetical protein